MDRIARDRVPEMLQQGKYQDPAREPIHLHSVDQPRSTRFQRLFRHQMALVLCTVTALTAVHFVLAAGGLGWLATNVIFVGGLAIAAMLLVLSIRLVGRETERSFQGLQSSYLSSERHSRELSTHVISTPASTPRSSRGWSSRPAAPWE